MFKTKLFSLIFFIVSSLLIAQNNSCILQGQILSENTKPIENATVYIAEQQLGALSDKDGYFKIEGIKPGIITLNISSLGYYSIETKIEFINGSELEQNFIMKANITLLDGVIITANKDYNNMKHLDDVEGTLIFAGKRNDVVFLDKTNANTSENIPRQVFSKVPGVYEWDMDGSGTQTSISVRGLNPHRSWEFNVRQNGYSVNSDVFGYPESHYNPATEALKKVELVRGGACLQYGPQYGGMLNYVVKEGPTDKKVDYESRQTVGSNGLFNSYNAIGGTIKKLNYFFYFNRRTSNGFRTNSAYDFYAGYFGLHYAYSDKLKIGIEFSKMYYINQFAGGLTDAQFEADPYQSTRSRNYFQPNHTIPAFTIDYTINTNTLFSLKSNLIVGERNSVMFIAPPTILDVIDSSTLQYAQRTVDRDYYLSLTNELRVLRYYKLNQKKQVISIGFRYSNSATHRQQKGVGTTASDFDLQVISPYLVDLTFKTNNYAFFAENLFYIGKKISITPGIRYEIIQTNMQGDISFTNLPFNYNKNRNIFLAGLGIQYMINNENSVYANCTEAYRPILYSDITPGSTLDIIDKNMHDSKGFNSDFGIRGKLNDYLIYDIGIYYLRYGNRVGALALKNELDQSYIYKTNVGTSIAKGFESLIEYHPTALKNATKSDGDLALFIAASYDNATYKEAITSANGQDVNLEGNKLENAPEWIIRSGLTYNYQFLSTTFQTSYVSKIYSDALNTETSENGVVGIVPAYFILDWNATFRFSNYNIKTGINNLNNAIYFTRRINNYPGPGILPADGRTFYISIGKEF